MKLQPFPKLRPITKVSPTLLVTLQQCQLEAGLRQAKAPQTIRSSKTALLGTIAHRVLEKARTVNKDSKDLRTQAKAIWDKTAAEMEMELQSSPLDRYLLPITRWRKYYRRRAQTIRRFEEIIASRGMSETQIVASERKFNIRDGFTGKPDLILQRENGLVIIDYKSTELSDDSESREEKIESWQQQILFYASIVKEEFGEWPVDGEIRLLNKEVIPIAIDPREAQELKQEARELKDNYNMKIASGSPHSELAQYSIDSCRFCEFKGACNTFWRENPLPIPGTDDYGCLSGRVLKVTVGKSRNGSIVIESEKLDGTSQEWEISNLSTEQFENLKDVAEGAFVRLINFKIESDGAYRAKPTQASVIWAVPEDF